MSISDGGTFHVETRYPKFPERTDFLKQLNALASASCRFLKEGQADAKDQARAAMNYEWTQNSSPEITYADAALISIRTRRYADTGGAHGNTYYSAATYAWANGKALLLKFSDVLDDQPASLQALKKACIKNLQAQKASWPDQFNLIAKESPPLNVTSAGLLFTFAPYSVGTFAEGTYTVLLPWKDAENYIAAESPVRRLLADSSPKAPTTATKSPTKSTSASDFPLPGN